MNSMQKKLVRLTRYEALTLLEALCADVIQATDEAKPCYMDGICRLRESGLVTADEARQAAGGELL